MGNKIRHGAGSRRLKLVATKDEMAIISDIAEELGYDAHVVEQGVLRYMEEVQTRALTITRKHTGLPSGILTLDAITSIPPGITLIYGKDSSGKTSLAKTIAGTFLKSEMNVVYSDAEHKLDSEDEAYLAGAILHRGHAIAPLRQLLRAKLIDLTVVDTITSLPSYYNTTIPLEKSVPFLLYIAQMRIGGAGYIMTPACSEQTLASSSLQLEIESRESIEIEGEPLYRIQVRIVKATNDHRVKGTRFPVILKDGLASSFYTAYDILKAEGQIYTTGRSKFIGNTNIGTLKAMNRQNRDLVCELAWKLLNTGKKPARVYQPIYNR